MDDSTTDLQPVPPLLTHAPLPTAGAEARPKKTTMDRNKERTAGQENTVWSYFSFHEQQDRSVCNICSTHLKGRNVSSAIRHLSIHSEEYESFVRKEAKRVPSKLNRVRLHKLMVQKQATADPSNKRTADQSVVSMQSSYSPAKRQHSESRANQVSRSLDSEARKHKLRTLLVELVTTTSVPAHLVDNDTFRKIISFLDPCIEIPSRETLVRSVSRTQDQVRSEMMAMLTAAHSLSIGIDVCTRKTVAQNMLCVTAYFFHMPDCRHVVLTLALKPLPATDPLTVRSVLDAVLADYNIRKKQVFRLITGSGCKMSHESDGEQGQNVLLMADERTDDHGDEGAAATAPAVFLNVHFCDQQTADGQSFLS